MKEIVIDIDDVIYNMVHDFPGGVPAMAIRVNENKNTLQLRVDPNNTTHHTPASLAAKIADVADSDELAKTFAARRSMICIHITKHEGASDMELFDLIINMEREKADWLASIQRALADGMIDPAEFQRIQKESYDHLSAVAELASRLESIVHERRKVAR